MSDTKKLLNDRFKNLALSLVASSVLFTGWAAAAESGGAAAESESEDKVVEAQERLSDTVLKAATSIDNFFSNERNSWTQNKTRVTLRGNLDWLDDQGWEFSPEFKLFLALPGLDDRLRLVVNDEDDDGTTDGTADDDDESNIALRFVGKVTKEFGVSYDLGLSTRDDEFQGFARANLYRHYGLGDKWVGRTEDRLYWYTQAGWRNDFRQYFERTIGDNKLFRSRTRIQYLEDRDDGWYPEQKFSLYQRFSDKKVVAWEAIYQVYSSQDSFYEPQNQLVQADEYALYQVRARWRQNVWQPWLFYEIWPIAAWPEERDYEFTPAIRLRLEIVLGDPPKKAVLEE